MPRAQTRLQLSLEKREYHPNRDDSSHLLSPTDAPADLQALHHWEQLSCLEQRPPRRTTPAWVRAWNSWEKWLWIVPIWQLLSGSISKESTSTWRERHTAPVPGRLSEWKLKSAFSSCKNPQEKSTDKMKIILVTLCTQTVVCLSLHSEAYNLFAYKLKNVWNENHNFTKIFRQRNKISFLK